MAERDETRQQQANAPSDGSSTETTTATGGNGDLEAQLKAATEEAAQYKDRFLRERAEMENFKKRQERLAGDRMQRYKRDLLEKVIEVMDNLDRAMQYESSMDQESLNQGLRMVHWQLEEYPQDGGIDAGGDGGPGVRSACARGNRECGLAGASRGYGRRGSAEGLHARRRHGAARARQGKLGRVTRCRT